MDEMHRPQGININEFSAFPNGNISVETSIPAFIGYTEKAIENGKDCTLVPVKILSYSAFVNHFGKTPSWRFSLGENVSTAEQQYSLSIKRSTHFILHNSVELFFKNGGSTCYIVSVGTYDKATQGVQKEDLEKGLASMLTEKEPTLIVMPEAILLERNEDCYDLQRQMLHHCGEEMKNRFSILDVFINKKKEEGRFEEDIQAFRKNIGSKHLRWGAAYFPFLQTLVVGQDAFSFVNISKENQELLIKLLKEGMEEKVKEEVDKISTVSKDPVEQKKLHETLWQVHPHYKKMILDMRAMVNLLPPSGAMAGIYAQIDEDFGVFRSPANVGVSLVNALAINITNEQQEDLNVPLDGKAVNAIRTFPGKGALVWGARTLDGNSLDFRYISVCRTLIFFDQSIQLNLKNFAFSPNSTPTWTNVKSAISNFLRNFWQNGGLAGASPNDAFSVRVGVGETMTPTDIQDGQMKVEVMVAITRPAEFIVLSFVQQMPTS